MTSGGCRARFVVVQSYDAVEYDEAGGPEYGYLCMAARTMCFSMTIAADAPGESYNRFSMYKYVVCQSGSGWFPSDHLRLVDDDGRAVPSPAAVPDTGRQSAAAPIKEANAQDHFVALHPAYYSPRGR